MTAQWPITKLAQNKYNTDNTHTNKQHKKKKTKIKQVAYNLFHRPILLTVYINYSNNNDSNNNNGNNNNNSVQ